jgi:hypothetical protein
MIPSEVENCIARYFLHMYLPDEVRIKVEERLLPSCLLNEEDDLDQDKLVRWAIEVIDKELGNKRFR